MWKKLMNPTRSESLTVCQLGGKFALYMVFSAFFIILMLESLINVYAFACINTHSCLLDKILLLQEAQITETTSTQTVKGNLRAYSKESFK